MADSNSSLSTSVAIGAGIMALIGAVDTVFDEGLAHNSVRTGWKTLLGCAGIGLNVSCDSGKIICLTRFRRSLHLLNLEGSLKIRLT